MSLIVILGKIRAVCSTICGVPPKQMHNIWFICPVTGKNEKKRFWRKTGPFLVIEALDPLQNLTGFPGVVVVVVDQVFDVVPQELGGLVSLARLFGQLDIPADQGEHLVATGLPDNFDSDPDQWVGGKFGNAVVFDGSNDHLSIDGYKGILGTVDGR